MVERGLLTLLKFECDKIEAVPCDGCLHILFEGIKTVVVRLGVKILTTCFVA